MLSPARRQSLKDELNLTVTHSLSAFESQWVESLAELIVRTIEDSFDTEIGIYPDDETPFPDADGKPLDGNLSPEDDGRWLDHSPDRLVDGDPLAS